MTQGIRKDLLNKLQKALAIKEKIDVFLHVKIIIIWGRSGTGQAVRLREGSLCTGLAAWMPKRKVGSAQGWGRLLAKPAPAKLEMKPKNAKGKDKSSNMKQETWKGMLIVAFTGIAKKWEQPKRPSTIEWVKEQSYSSDEILCPCINECTATICINRQVTTEICSVWFHLYQFKIRQDSTTLLREVYVGGRTVN